MRRYCQWAEAEQIPQQRQSCWAAFFASVLPPQQSDLKDLREGFKSTAEAQTKNTYLSAQRHAGCLKMFWKLSKKANSPQVSCCISSSAQLNTARRLKPSSPTSLVLSMAFKMATFSFSRADRTLTYSPRCGVKYSGGKDGFVQHFQTCIVSDTRTWVKITLIALNRIQVARPLIAGSCLS